MEKCPKGIVHGGDPARPAPFYTTKWESYLEMRYLHCSRRVAVLVPCFCISEAMFVPWELHMRFGWCVLLSQECRPDAEGTTGPRTKLLCRQAGGARGLTMAALPEHTTAQVRVMCLGQAVMIRPRIYLPPPFPSPSSRPRLHPPTHPPTRPPTRRRQLCVVPRAIQITGSNLLSSESARG